ncbi:DNA (cytosine-5-)-methyltransferase [Photobacterium phosphoreum]|uniref:DNA (cytosine-5-)-methyltransferase n=1 Tax=Photobacterium phosphoreum TaxID=659 RepID=UPI000D16194A|nr:DNA (cytosine-5-)-methyltransferase [Photobacterium phosphoreum]PSU61762.1 DNA (cytosine-5-)-methyltransferase [Photobacterium phosphoreum]
MDSKELIRARKHLSLTQKEAAAFIKVSQRTWQQWELGQRHMRPAFWELFLIKTNYKPEKEKMKAIFNEYTQKDIKTKHEELAELTHKQEQEKNKNKDLKFIDLFCGVGGIRKAFESTGAGCVFSSEIDLFAQFTYYTNYGVVPYGDITKINPDDIPDHDILCAGFPCQPFSHIGKREGFAHPTQGTMFHEIIKILEIKKPRGIFLENVPGLINHDNGNTLATILDALSDLGYNCKHHVYNAAKFGVPQNRKRFYLVGFLNEQKFEFPKEKEMYVDIGNYVEKNIEGYSISEHLQKSYLFKKDDGKPAVITQETKGQIKTLVSTYHKIQRLTGTFVKDGETGLRLLTSNECKAIMGFPKDFIIPVSRTQMYRQMGNSVVIPVIKFMAEEITKTMVSSKKNVKVEELA